MISISQKGSFKNLESFFRSIQKQNLYSKLDSLAQEGVNALSSATPVLSGETASSWNYKINIQSETCSIEWYNTVLENGFPVAIMLQYGHGTGTGGYIQGIDYINPAIQPIFDRIANQVWGEVVSA